MDSFTQLLFDRIDTPIGELTIVADEASRLHAVGFSKRHVRMREELGNLAMRPEASLTAMSNPGGLSVALQQYFAGDLGAIVGLPLVMKGTGFQCSV